MDSLKDILNNKYLVGFITVGTVLYASLARPALTQGVAQVFEHPITKMIFYALIVLLLTQNLQAAIVVAIAFYVLMSMLREQRIAEGFIDGLKTEGFFNQQYDEMESFYADQTNSTGQNQPGQNQPGQNQPGQNQPGQEHDGILNKCLDQCMSHHKGNRQEFAQKLEQCLKQQHQALGQGSGQAYVAGKGYPSGQYRSQLQGAVQSQQSQNSQQPTQSTSTTTPTAQ